MPKDIRRFSCGNEQTQGFRGVSLDRVSLRDTGKLIDKNWQKELPKPSAQKMAGERGPLVEKNLLSFPRSADIFRVT